MQNAICQLTRVTSTYARKFRAGFVSILTGYRDHSVAGLPRDGQAQVCRGIQIPVSRGKLPASGTNNEAREHAIYTCSKDGKTIYATRLSWPEHAFTLTSFAAGGVGKDVKINSVALLGSDAEIQWKRAGEGIAITPPSTPVLESKDWPVTFKLEVD